MFSCRVGFILQALREHGVTMYMQMSGYIRGEAMTVSQISKLCLRLAKD